MGVHVDDLAALGRGFYSRLSELSVAEMLDLSVDLSLSVDLPETDEYDAVRQQIVDQLQSVEPRRP